MTVFTLALLMGFPAAVLVLERRYSLVRRISPIVICFLAGVLIGNVPLIPPETAGLRELLSTLTVPLAIPLMLFSMDLRAWRRLAGRSILSMALAFLAVTAATLVGHLLLRGLIPETWKVAGLLIGVYTGGTPNLAALKVALNVENSLYLAAHTADMAVGAVYILFIITLARKVFSRVLPAFADTRLEVGLQARAEWGRMAVGCEGRPLHGEQPLGHEPQPFHLEGRGRPFRAELPLLLAGVGLALLIAGAGAAVSEVAPAGLSMMLAILTITTLSILASLVPAVRRLPLTFQAGNYVILVFCLVVGSMADVRVLLTTAPVMLLYVALAVFGSMLLHLLLCRLFRIDVDTMIITSTSAICSPPFVGLVAMAIRNPAVILPGITTGLVGYAAGNYLGIGIAHLFKLLLP